MSQTKFWVNLFDEKQYINNAQLNKNIEILLTTFVWKIFDITWDSNYHFTECLSFRSLYVFIKVFRSDN